MEFLLSNIFFALFSAVAGVFLGWMIADPDRLPEWIALNKLGSGTWEGEWWCIWQSPEDKNKIIIDEVQLKQRLGKLKLKVIKPGAQYIWEAIGAIRTAYFMGEWKALRSHAHSRGTFALYVYPQGDRMEGHFVGPDYAGNPISLEAILTSDRELVEKAKRMIADSSNAKLNKSLHRLLR